MKNIYFLFFGLLFSSALNAQIINFPDVKFKNMLLASVADTNPNYYYIAADAGKNDMLVDTNGNGEIEVSEAQGVYYLTVQGDSSSASNPNDLDNLGGIEYFTNLRELNCADNNLTSLDVSALSNLKSFRCDRNNLTSLNITGITTLISFWYGSNFLPNLDLSQLVALDELGCDNNQMATLDVSNSISLKFLVCSNNALTALELSNLTNLTSLFCDHNQITDLDLSNMKVFGSLHANDNPLQRLNLKGGHLFTYQNLTIYNMNLANCQSLEYVCVDESNLVTMQAKLNSYGLTNCNLNTYCSFVPGGQYWTVQGNAKFDIDTDGCDNEDIFLPRLKLLVSNGANSGSFIANEVGQYNIPLQYGTHTITPSIQNAAYFMVSPASFTTTLPLFPVGPDPVQNFCVTPLGSHNDVESILLPIGIARPGFNSQYKIIYKNNGNTIISGEVHFTFMDALMDFVGANPTVTSQTINELNFSYQNLKPFESREILVTFNINSPTETPSVIAGTDLGFSTIIFPLENDDYILDNFAALKQIAVNSFDPNDKTCLEGNSISPEDIGKYVHYMIRFENTGTANAQSIVVKDMIDMAKFDITSLIPLDGSHAYVTRIKDNKVEFIFENINLPFDDANNDGYVLFKIRTNPTLVLGDTFSNTASIYFDYNFSIVTEPAVTTIAVLKTKDFEFDEYFTVYPNPVDATLQIQTKKDIAISSISIYNILGQVILIVPNAAQIQSVDVSALKTGNYFIKVNSDRGTSNSKFIKK